MEHFKIENGVLIGYKGREKQVTVPRGTLCIGAEAFQENRFVERVELPYGLTVIGSSAFKDCGRLREINIPDTVTVIDEKAFMGCEALTEIVIPYGVERIEDMTFCSCTSLADARIPSSVSSIGSGAFTLCTSLEEFNVPEGVKSIEAFAFYGCSSMKRIRIPEGVREIGAGAFSLCMSLGHLFLPQSVLSIGKEAFSGFSAGGVIDMNYQLVGQLEKSYAEATWAAVRGFIRRWEKGLTDDGENAFWREYVVRRLDKAFRHLVNEPDFYRYLTVNNMLRAKRADTLLDMTENAECRAMLLEYSNRRRGRKKTLSDTFFDL